jgi:murein L,D-transpeptidase YafK
MKHFLTLMISFLIMSSSYAKDEFLPSNLLMLDDKFTHHVLLVEKSTHKLFLYQNVNGLPKLVKTFKIATGKQKGNKLLQGDKKTPEGIYSFQQFFSDNQLLDKYGDYAKIYGAGAFTTNYPNVIDQRLQKTGGGIWLHSTDDDKRIDKGLDSRGCVVVVDNDLKDISQYIDLKHTSMVIVQDVDYMRKESWITLKNDILNSVHQWANSWQNKKFDSYINSYSKEEFFNSQRGNWYGYKQYKKAVFARQDKPQIFFSNTSALYFRDYAVVTLKQDYSSDTIQDVGKKVLYLKRDPNYNWKIVAEQWYALDSNEDIAFTPSMRFFNKEEN